MGEKFYEVLNALVGGNRISVDQALLWKQMYNEGKLNSLADHLGEIMRPANDEEILEALRALAEKR